MNTTATKTHLSKKGMKELKKQISSLEHMLESDRRDLRDLDKTAGYEERLALVEKLAHLEAVETELIEKRDTLRNATLLPRKRDALRVAIGSVVDLLDTSGRMVRYTLVESMEANPSDGRISVQSPLGRSLLGKQLKDPVEWTAARGRQLFTLVRIS